MSNMCRRYFRKAIASEKKTVLNVDTQFEDNILTYWSLEQFLFQKQDRNCIKLLHDLHRKVRKFVKHLGVDVVPDAVIELLLMFLDDAKFLNSHYNKVKQKFGNVSLNDTENIFKLVQQFKSIASSDCLEFIVNNLLPIEYNEFWYCVPTLYTTNCDFRSKLRSYRKAQQTADVVKNFSMLYNGTSNKHSKAQPKNTSNSRKKIPEVSKAQPKASSKPSYGHQVVVQSQQEKILSKQLRKLDKKKQKNFNGVASTDEYVAVKSEYNKASAAPVLKKTPYQDVTVFPNVFDSTPKSRYSKASVHGNCLPGNVKHTDKGKYEEVFVPPTGETVMSNLGKTVNISLLDDIGQVVFRTVDSLNVIQSLVFPVAYLSNENMLICAPTGAGKTNVALLTITHQIRQHIVKGVIERHKFKIVYIVPMKALAAEITANFSSRLSPLGISVKECTGDMQLTSKEIRETQLIVTTPEKWDVITRKGGGENGITDSLKLLIIDEVHLLQGMRGPIIEAIVARTLRQVEASQSMIRIIGLSATLPNYVNVARFLNVNPNIGLFYFDGRFRPVPLTQIVVGIKPMKSIQTFNEMDNVCFTKVLEFVQQGHQVIVFVHARNMTVHTATVLKEKASASGHSHSFKPIPGIETTSAIRHFAKSSNKALSDLLAYGFSVHHAGLLRSDRNMVEKYFREGVIRVLVSTATLAWGVNLPAHAVIIKGSEIYDSKRGTFVNLDILDVLQIFGRAGRPQYDKTGTGVLITTHENLNHYVSLLTNQIPIESSFLERLPDHLNAEIVLGTVSNVMEALKWIEFTYLHQRLQSNPQNYGISYADQMEDPSVFIYRLNFITIAAEELDKARMIRFNSVNGDFMSTDLGRTASHYYISYDTVQLFNNCIEPFMTEKEILAMISQAEEFEQLKVRNDECDELEELLSMFCELAVPGGATNVHGKVNILMQTYLSRGRIKNFSLVSDMAYVSQNVVRITRALFDIALHQNAPVLAGRCLTLSLMFDLQLWDFQSPLRQFTTLNYEILEKLDHRNMSIENLREIDVNHLKDMLRSNRYAALVKKCAEQFPLLQIESVIQPITRSVLRIKLMLKPDFEWNDKVHGRTSESFWLWIEDPDNNMMYYSEHVTISKYNVINKLPVELLFTVPLVEPQPSQYLARVSSDKWLRSVVTHALSFRELVLPESHPPNTDLLELQPLPLTALKNKKYESLYTFTHFNPIQTQTFHCLYHTDHNTLVGAPTGSGKTIIAELAVLRLFNRYPHMKVVYIAPLKALVRERVEDWKKKFEKQLGKCVTELTGDVNPNIREIQRANIIITTPEKWDGLSRSWQSRNYVKQVGLMVIDEIHLLGEDRGPVLEVIVSRTNYISANTTHKIRIIGLSTAMANVKDLANWLGIGEVGLYNFRPSVRPVPLEVHISGHPGKHYCPRMISMNKPTYQAIRLHAPDSPSLVFVSSRRQTRLTALDLIKFLAADTDSKQWLHMDEHEMEQIVSTIRDPNLKLCLQFGIGIHHAGLEDHDRRITEELFVNQKIQVLVATATLAWGVNFPAHLVVIKGTEYFDGKTGRYVDMPITDVLQMMGRAGRPQFDNTGVAVILVHDIKKNFYKKFLYEPFPVESNLLQVMPDHINAEVVAGTITTKNNLLEYLTWTYFFRRLIQNPTYYNLSNLDEVTVSGYLNDLSLATLNKLIESNCLTFDEETNSYQATPLGQIASYYYLKNESLKHFCDNMKYNFHIGDLLRILSNAYEYSDFPVRHNEDIINSDLARICRLKADAFDSSHTKVFLLFQAHFSRLPMPILDYITDLKSAIEQSMRILQAMIDVAASFSWLSCTLRIQQILQMIIQGCWVDDSPFLQLHNFDNDVLKSILQAWCFEFPDFCPDTLPGIKAAYQSNKTKFMSLINNNCKDNSDKFLVKNLDNIPTVHLEILIQDENNDVKYFGELSNLKINAKPSTDYSLIIIIKRQGKKSLAVKSNYFPKRKDEMWFLNLGYPANDELIVLKRMTVYQNTKQKITFVSPSEPGNYIFTLYLMSDSYVGLDQQYNINLKVLP